MEHNKDEPPTLLLPIPPEARAASQRAYEILCMARALYDTISEREQQRRRRSLHDSGKLDDTTSFFAACEQQGGGTGLSRNTNNGNSSVVEEDAMENRSSVPDDYVAPPIAEVGINGRFNSMSTKKVGSTEESSQSSSTSSSSVMTATSMASSVFSNVISKMVIPKKQGSFTDIGKKFMGSTTSGGGSDGTSTGLVGGSKVEAGGASSSRAVLPQDEKARRMGDYEILINNEMLGLTVENVLERTIIRTLLPDGAAAHAGAQVGSLIAKVGNVDTCNLTHFETIDELRRSQRPLKLTLRHVRGSVLRRAREEMGRLLRGRGLETSTTTTDGGGGSSSSDMIEGRPWKGSSPKQRTSFIGETFDSVLTNRWPLKANNKSSQSANSLVAALTRSESLHQAGRKLIRILVLFVIGLEKEMSSSNIADNAEHAGARRVPLSSKELSEALEISSKVLLEYSRSLSGVTDERSRATMGTASATFAPQGSSYYPVPPGRVQGRKSGPPAPSAGKGQSAQKGKKQSGSSPLLQIGDALQRTRSFLVERSSVPATALRWEIIDYLCMILDLDTEQELSEQESASSTSGTGDVGSPMNDLGAAGSILKLIVVNCSTVECDEGTTDHHDDIIVQAQNELIDSELSFLGESFRDQSERSNASPASTSGNSFLSVVHRLAASKSISGRVSACSLSPILWSHLDFPRQLQLRGIITRALHDVEIMVRKSTAVVLHDIAELVFDRRAVPWLVLMCERSMTDPEPQLRAAAMTLTWHLAEHLPNAFLGDASKGSRSIRRLPPRDSQTFMDVYLLQCKLFPVANNLAEDRVASVRLSVAAQCDRLCNAMGEHWFSVIIDLLQALLSDNDDMVRSEAILCMPRLVETVIVGTSNIQGSIKVLESLLPLALKMQKDASSLVRSSLATATGELLIFLVGLGGGGGSASSHHEAPPSPGQPPPSPGGSGTVYWEHKKHVDDTLIPILQKLLQDSDPEVTTASLRAVTNASRSGTARERSNSRIPPSSNIDDDLVSLSSHQSHHSHYSHTSHDRTKPVFIPVLSEKQVLRLLPTLSNLGTSNQWRVRQSAVEIVPALMGCTHRHETRHEISKLCVKLMHDKVDAVRKTAAECLCLGGGSLARHGEEDGGEWVKAIVIPHLRECSHSDDSKQRLLSLKMVEYIFINGLCPTISSAAEVDVENHCPSSPARDDDESISSSVTDCEKPSRLILNIAASHSSDKVANVRLNVGRTFGSILPLLDRSDVDFVVETIQKQLDDETSRSGGGDQDVIYFAQQAISMSQPFRRMLSRASTCSNDDGGSNQVSS